MWGSGFSATRGLTPSLLLAALVSTDSFFWLSSTWTLLAAEALE